MSPGKLMIAHECCGCKADLGFYAFDMPNDSGQEYPLGMSVPKGADSVLAGLVIYDSCSYCQIPINGRVEVINGTISGVIEIQGGLEVRVAGPRDSIKVNR